MSVPECNNVFPDWYTIDQLGLESLCFFLREKYDGKTIFIDVLRVNDSIEWQAREDLKNKEQK